MSLESNADEVAARLQRGGLRAVTGIRRTVRHFGMLLETRIKANASLPATGPPGPRAITGDYRASWNTRHSRDGGTFTSEVGTDRPQGRRLEYGFVGADRLGRVYNQPPYPHVRPALAEIEPQFVKAIEGDIRGAFE